VREKTRCRAKSQESEKDGEERARSDGVLFDAAKSLIRHHDCTRRLCHEEGNAHALNSSASTSDESAWAPLVATCCPRADPWRGGWSQWSTGLAVSGMTSTRFPVGNTDMAAGQLITNHTLLRCVACQCSKVGGDIRQRMGVLACPLGEVVGTTCLVTLTCPWR
jgi:hypothetical protein